MKNGRLLVVDDALETVEVLRRNLEACGYQVSVADSVATAVEVLARTPVDLVITDLRMPGASGLDLVRHVREVYADTEVMVITGYPSIDTAVRAVKTGADDYLAKPFTDDELAAAVSRALAKLRARQLTGARASTLPRWAPALLGESEGMRALQASVARAMLTDSPVLVVGESGTGKTLVARSIHYRSERAAGLFVVVDCATLPDSHSQGELLGHAHSSGATAEPPLGLIRAAERGTLFVRSVEHASPDTQLVLLRLLRDGEYAPLGSSLPRRADVRVLSTATADLGELVQRRLFQRELYDALRSVVVEVPALRTRGEDVVALALTLAAASARALDRPAPWLSDDAADLLRQHDWPGNLRELGRVMDRAVRELPCQPLDAAHLAALLPATALRGETVARPLAEVEDEHIRRVVASVDGNRSRAAEILGIDRKTLREKLRR